MSDCNQGKCGGKSCSECGGGCDAGKKKLHTNLAGVKHIILVMSGKGGVGKSTVSTNLAMALSLRGLQVGLLDTDFHGPSVPKMLGLEGAPLLTDGDMILPVDSGANLKVMSIGFTLDSPHQAVIWRGPVKYGVLQQLLGDVKWGELDYLIVDVPPGTGDEALSLCQMLPEAQGAVVVTTPQQVAATDVSKSLDFLRQMDFNIVGLVENMSGFACPHCGEITAIFSSGAGEELAAQYGIQVIGRIPIDPAVCGCGDKGTPVVAAYPESATAKAFSALVDNVVAQG
ncbi:MAG: Mrp/NBP35 family ATP-binding protein [Victivallales bacterium]|nr:Mrp/NBP35 family ATP-binding protein [Victivallales bacterium]